MEAHSGRICGARLTAFLFLLAACSSHAQHRPQMGAFHGCSGMDGQQPLNPLTSDKKSPASKQPNGALVRSGYLIHEYNFSVFMGHLKHLTSLGSAIQHL
jgi:hypothetical protein